VQPSLVDGRAPTAPDELLLGTVTAARLGVGLGDEILVHGLPDQWAEPGTAVAHDVTMRVVGTGVLPFAAGDRLGTGAAVTSDGLRALSGMDQPDSLFLRFAPGADRTAVVRELIADVGLEQPDADSLEEELSPLTDEIPVLDVRQVDRLPLLLGALMVVMSLAVLAHVLVSAVSARREELALLRAIGFSRAQVRRTVAWQAVTIAFAALAVGVPLGVVVGRSVWLVFAERLGVVPEAVAPWSIVLIAPLVLVAALAVATLPGWLAARSRPAAILRAE
jgi:ABC-type lipoprotein release transport system permease subunit